MAIDVVAESGQEFSAWLDRQRQPAQPPSTDTERRGRDVFVNGTCATCHTITGTRAHGQLAPDLTHIASRARLASATIPNLPGHLAEWIRNPQSFKPGSEMPPQMLAADDLEALGDTWSHSSDSIATRHIAGDPAARAHLGGSGRRVRLAVSCRSQVDRTPLHCDRLRVFPDGRAARTG